MKVLFRAVAQRIAFYRLIFFISQQLVATTMKGFRSAPYAFKLF